ncbi:hypothetical protein IT575_06250 [bacterium]|nr:hypothetical protein [bacterium]
MTKPNKNTAPVTLRPAALLASAALLACLGCAGKQGLQGILDDGVSAPARSVESLKDTDRDGLSDRVEQQIGTDPALIDTDMDGLTDQYEVWGWQGIAIGRSGPLGGLADPNANGTIAALDRAEAADKVLSRTATAALDVERIRVVAPGGDAIENDLDGDYIPTDFELAGFYYEIDPLSGEDWFVKWDGDIARPYFKTDPTKWSSDADPWSDWEEATKRNLDQRVKSPGDHPCIPAYPNIQAVLTSYSIEDASKISSTNGKSSASGWTNSVENSNKLTTDWEASVTASVEYEHKFEVKAAIPPVSATTTATVGVKVAGHYGSKTETSSKTTNDTSGLSSEEWKAASAGDTINTAKLILNLRMLNIGTLPASKPKVKFNLKLGDFVINTFVVNLSGEGQAAGFGELEALAANSLDVTVLDNGITTAYVSSEPLYISMQQLKTLQLGSPLSIEPVSFEAQTIVGEFDSSTGRRINLNIGPWSPYQSALENASARLLIDVGPDPDQAAVVGDIPPLEAFEQRVFAYDNTGSYVGSPPVITLSDAFIWAFGCQTSPFGPTVRLRDPVTHRLRIAYLENFIMGFDPASIAEIAADAQLRESIFAIPIKPSNPAERVYVAQSPPRIIPQESINEELPQMQWASLYPYRQIRRTLQKPVAPPASGDPGGINYDLDNPPLQFDRYIYQPVFTPVVRAYATDFEGIQELRFKPGPNSVGEVMRLSSDPLRPEDGGFWEYRVPAGYHWTGFEQVLAIGIDGDESAAMNIEIQEGSYLDEKGRLVVGEYRDPLIYGTFNGPATSASEVFDIVADFNASGVEAGDTITNLDRGTAAEVSAVTGPHSLDISNWTGTGAQEFKYGESYAISSGTSRYYLLGFELLSAIRLVADFEKTNPLRSIGCNFAPDANVLLSPYSIVASEDFTAGTKTLSCDADQVIGMTTLGAAPLSGWTYDSLRKASYSTSSIQIYSLALNAQSPPDLVYAVKLFGGRYAKFRFNYSVVAAPNQPEILSVDYVILEGI